MAAEQVEVVQEVYAAMKRGDHARMFGLIAPKVSIWQSQELSWGGTHEGIDEAKLVSRICACGRGQPLHLSECLLTHML